MSCPSLFLASSSPRRRELLAQIGVGFRVLDVATDESRHGGEDIRHFVMRMARDKARAGRLALDGECGNTAVLGADTVVVLDGAMLGKPVSHEDGVAMLRALSGCTHQVMTAVAINNDGDEQCRVCQSRVTFRELDDNEIEAYWQSGEPRDKAGAYAIQGMAAVFIKRLEGSYSGVMGLPLFETADMLAASGIRLPAYRS